MRLTKENEGATAIRLRPTIILKKLWISPWFPHGSLQEEDLWLSETSDVGVSGSGSHFLDKLVGHS